MTEDAEKRFSGELMEVRLTDIVQLACLGQLTQAIAVKTAGLSGNIHIHSGQVCHAEIMGAQGGEGAFYQIFTWREGYFEMAPCGESCDLRSIAKNWEFLLIEAMRQSDVKMSSETETGLSENQPRGGSFSGSIADISLLDVVQLMCMGGGSRDLQVECISGNAGIFSRDGQIIHAELGDLRGEVAFNEIFKWEQGHFRCIPLTGEAAISTIDKPWEHLLMEAMRLRDETSEGAGDNREHADKIEPLLQRIQRMKVAEKIRLAMVGDKESRNILMRDPNRLVQFAIISNPRITEGEIAVIAASRGADEDILRRIGHSREWVKYYPIRLGLCTNPKTPIAISSRLLETLTQKDLKLIAKSKSVPSAVAQAARRMNPG